MGTRTSTAAVLLVGFVAGLGFGQWSAAMAARNEAKVDVTHKIFAVTIAEVKQSFVFFEQFAGSYKTTVKLSDGTTRTVELTPTVHDGKELVQINDTGHVTYTSLTGMAVNGPLMIQVRSMEDMYREMCQQGWKRGDCGPE